MDFIIETILFTVGLAVLLKGASIFTDSASRIAKSLGVSDIAIGLTLVAFTTSLPELAVSVLSAFRGVQGIALGNVIGSNIANVGLVLGLAALMTPAIAIHRSELKQGYIMIAVTLISVLFLVDGLSPVKGIILLAGLLGYIYYLSREKDLKENVIGKIMERGNLSKGMILCAAGAAGVLLGAEILIGSSIRIAESFGISEAVIGLTLVAVGTSLPELATSITAAVKKLEGIALGNIIGSNIFNLMMVMGASALAGTITADLSMLSQSVPVMILLSVILVILMKTENRLGRIEGVALLSLYAFFIYMKFFL
jgi:cation:H+ antiporter